MNFALARIELGAPPRFWNPIRATAGVEYPAAAAAPLCREVNASFALCLHANLIQDNSIASVVQYLVSNHCAVVTCSFGLQECV